ncbi:hypothetical protein CWE13_02845 [Aliidiomarina shirensis]|uniref:Low molecular weight protein antigen 6 PH domain-containing protein n=1 Tax=Aliidiomarina shirensis TaxID=1048642 RepID=A0A432WXS7_9GAMM|nr:PH domain-containing protein [Aliidiomarina shirensis]RUO38600.1 hypothetical protein CWE13_02845 [Aliidiomarina shirensis]
MSNTAYFRWQAYKRFFPMLFVCLIVAYTVIRPALNGNWAALIALLFSASFAVIATIAIYKNGVWVVVDDEGVTLRHLFKQKSLRWSEIVRSSTVKFKWFIYIAHIETRDNNFHSLPISGLKAKSISECINRMVREKAAKY